MVNSEKNTALMAASFMGHVQAVKLLRKAEAKMVNSKGLTALAIALQNKHFECAQELVADEGKILVNVDGEELPPLFLACKVNAFQSLIEALAKGNCGRRDKNGKLASDYVADAAVKARLVKLGDK